MVLYSTSGAADAEIGAEEAGRMVLDVPLATAAAARRSWWAAMLA